MAICHRSELRIYGRSGTGTYTALPFTSISWSKQLGGAGFLSATIDARQATIAASPAMLDDCVIKVALPLSEPGTTLTEVAAFANRARNGTLWSGAGEQTREISQAPSLWTAWAQDAILHTEANSIPQMAAEQRYFGFQSSLYAYASDADFDWGTPYAVAQQDSSSGDRAGNPQGWPSELGNAYWITRPAGTSSEKTRHLYVTDVTVPSDCYLTVYYSGDESAAVYFAGALVIHTSSSETGYKDLDTWSAWVTAGTYRCAIDKTSVISRGGDGVDPVLLAVATNNDNGSVKTILRVTDTTHWKSYPLHPVTGEAPALTPGRIMRELHDQAKARGVDTWKAITPTFTATADSKSAAWPHREERTWRIGYDTYLDMIEGLGDLGVDVDITPSLQFTARAGDGADKSATVRIEALVGADSIREAGSAIVGTMLWVETQDGWTPTPLKNTKALSKYGRREAALSLGNSPSIAQGVKLGQKALDERLAQPLVERSVEFYAVPGCVPFVDFDLGDRVGVKIGSTTIDGVVLDLGCQQDHTEAICRWTAKIGEVLDDLPS